MKFEEFDFELDEVKKEIEDSDAERVLIQLPAGFKRFATRIVDELEVEDKDLIIWADSCFGPCDVPETNCGLVIQFGHNEWKKLN